MSSLNDYYSGAVFTKTRYASNPRPGGKDFTQTYVIGTSDLNYMQEVKIQSLADAATLGYKNNGGFTINTFLYNHFAIPGAGPVVVLNILDMSDVDFFEDFTQTVNITGTNFAGLNFTKQPVKISDTTFTVIDGLDTLVYGTDYVMDEQKLLRIKKTGFTSTSVSVTHKIVDETAVSAKFIEVLNGTSEIGDLGDSRDFYLSGNLMFPIYNKNQSIISATSSLLSLNQLRTFACDTSVSIADILSEIDAEGNTTVYGAILKDRVNLITGDGEIKVKTFNNIDAEYDYASIHCSMISSLGVNFIQTATRIPITNYSSISAVKDYRELYFENNNVTPVERKGNKALGKGLNIVYNKVGQYYVRGNSTSLGKTDTGFGSKLSYIQTLDFLAYIIASTLVNYLDQYPKKGDFVGLVSIAETDVIAQIQANAGDLIAVDPTSGGLAFVFKLDPNAFEIISTATTSMGRLPFEFDFVPNSSIEAISSTVESTRELFLQVLNNIISTLNV